MRPTLRAYVSVRSACPSCSVSADEARLRGSLLAIRKIRFLQETLFFPEMSRDRDVKGPSGRGLSGLERFTIAQDALVAPAFCATAEGDAKCSASWACSAAGAMINSRSPGSSMV